AKASSPATSTCSASPRCARTCPHSGTACSETEQSEPHMKLIEPQIAALSTAKDWFLVRYGLSEADVTAALDEIFAHRVDYADVYFQYARSESWSLEEGRVKSGSFDIEEGVGIRAVTGEKQAF